MQPKDVLLAVDGCALADSAIQAPIRFRFRLDKDKSAWDYMRRLCRVKVVGPRTFPRADSRAVGIGTPGILSMMFPWIFHDSRMDPSRECGLALSGSRFSCLAKQVVLNSEAYLQEPDIVFLLYHTKMQALARGQAYAISRATRMSLESMKEALINDDASTRQLISCFLGNLPGSVGFWKRQQNELMSLMEPHNLGPAHIFFTVTQSFGEEYSSFFSAAGLDCSKSLYRAVHRMAGHSNLIFVRKTQDLLKSLTDHDGVRHWWARYEWQMRQYTHMHGFLWLEEFMDEIASEEDLKNYFFSTFACWNPMVN